MKRMGRRQFTKLAGRAALLAPLAPSLAGPLARGARESALTQSGQAAPEPKLKLTKEQEERVKQALERRDRQLATLHGHPLPYSAEPAFLFHVRLPQHRRNVKGHNVL